MIRWLSAVLGRFVQSELGLTIEGLINPSKVSRLKGKAIRARSRGSLDNNMSLLTVSSQSGNGVQIVTIYLDLAGKIWSRIERSIDDS